MAKTILAIISLFMLGVLTGSFLFRKKGMAQTDEAQKAKEDKKNEIESTPASALVSDADNADELCTAKETIRADFRSRIRHRLNEELHRVAGGAADSDAGPGSTTGD